MKHARITIKTFPIGKLIPHPKNPRIHPEPGTPEWDALKRSLQKDFFDPLVVNSGKTDPLLANVLVSGHLRTKVLTEMGVEKVDAVVVDYDDATHTARLMAANNQTGEWDERSLADLLAGLPEEAQADAGFPADELARLLAVSESNGEAEEADPVPPKPFNYKPQFGVIVVCKDEAEQEKVYGRLQGEGLNCKVVVT